MSPSFLSYKSYLLYEEDDDVQNVYHNWDEPDEE